MPFQTGVSFTDGLVSIDKLQKMSQNDDYLYNDVISRPYGIIGLGERETNFSNVATNSIENILTGVYVKPPTENRLVAVHVNIPKMQIINATTAQNGTTFYVYRDGEQIHTFTSSQMSALTTPQTLYTSFLETLKKKIRYEYKLAWQATSIASRQQVVCTKALPIQIWIEDWGQSAI